MQDGCILCWVSWYLLFFLMVHVVLPSFPFQFRRLHLHNCLNNAETVPIRTVNRQCSSGLQAVADVAASIKAGFYDMGERQRRHHFFFICAVRVVVKLICHNALPMSFLNAGIGAGLESMTANPMAWEGSVNPKV